MMPNDNSSSSQQPSPSENLASTPCTDELPRHGRLAAIDLGTVRIGIAICDPSQTWTSPYETWNRRPGMEEKYFRELIQRERIVGFVVGLPLHNDGRESPISRAARDFAQWLKSTSHLPVTLFDERFSSAQAAALLDQMELTEKKRKQRLDQLSAHIILEAYLQSTRQNSPPTMPIYDTPSK
jgi:putative Holliday junction resolvase